MLDTIELDTITYAITLDKVLCEEYNYKNSKKDVVFAILATITPEVEGHSDLDLTSYEKSITLFFETNRLLDDFREYEELSTEDLKDWVINSKEYKEASDLILINLYTNRVTLGIDVDEDGNGPFSTVIEKTIA